MNGNEGTGTAQEPPTRSRPSNVEHDQSPSTATARTLEYPPATADEAGNAEGGRLRPIEGGNGEEPWP